MKYPVKVALSLAGVAALIGLCAALWFSLLELRWTKVRKKADVSSTLDMKAAVALLRQRGHTVHVVESLDTLHTSKLADGTLLLADMSGLMSPATARDLLVWVKRGNTLVMRPRFMDTDETRLYTSQDKARHKAGEPDSPSATADEADEHEDEVQPAAGADDAVQAGRLPRVVAATPEQRGSAEIDPIGAHFGVRLYDEDEDADPCHKLDREACKAKIEAQEAEAAPGPIALPGHPYLLYLSYARSRMVHIGHSPLPFWGDDDGALVRGYDSGAGHVVLVGSNYFHDYYLRKRDNAELLVTLATLSDSRAVTIVLNADVPKWYRALWNHYKLALISLGCLLLLMLWAALRRFGPMLPQPLNERRSLMEHIDASGAWLWKADGGRQVLLDAARSDTMELIARRAPALARMHPDRLAEALANLAGLEQSHVVEALQREAFPQIPMFIRQIRTLQTLRNHYER